MNMTGKLAAFAILAALSAAVQSEESTQGTQGELSWVDYQKSPAISTVGRDITVSFSHANTNVPLGAKIAGMHVNQSSYHGGASFRTKVCVGSFGNCVYMSDFGNDLNTQAFDGQAANQTVWVIYNVQRFGSVNPIFVDAQVTVWFR